MSKLYSCTVLTSATGGIWWLDKLALGLKNKTTIKNLKELHGFCPITMLPGWYKRILIIQQRHTITSSQNSFTNRYFHPIFPLHTGFWIWFCSTQAFGTVFVLWQFLNVFSCLALMPTTGVQHLKTHFPYDYTTQISVCWWYRCFNNHRWQVTWWCWFIRRTRMCFHTTK
jgi:hypothetical protein